MNALHERWRALAGRERMLVGAAFALLLLTVAQLGWRATRGALEDLRADVAAQRAALAMARTLDAAGSAPGHSGEPLLTLAERSAREGGVGSALKRLDGDDAGRVRARLEAAPFGTVVRWLAAVQAASGAGIESITLERSTEPGRVDANIVLAPAGR